MAPRGSMWFKDKKILNNISPYSDAISQFFKMCLNVANCGKMWFCDESIFLNHIEPSGEDLILH